jgi:hypothetical protein
MNFNGAEWIAKVDQVKTDEGFIALLKQVYEATDFLHDRDAIPSVPLSTCLPTGDSRS